MYLLEHRLENPITVPGSVSGVRSDQELQWPPDNVSTDTMLTTDNSTQSWTQPEMFYAEPLHKFWWAWYFWMSDGKPITYENWNSGKHNKQLPWILGWGCSIEKFVWTHIKSLIFQNQTRLDKLKQRQPLTKWQRLEVEGPAPPSEIVAKYEEMF